MTITGLGNYTGEITATFKIVYTPFATGDGRNLPLLLGLMALALTTGTLLLISRKRLYF